MSVTSMDLADVVLVPMYGGKLLVEEIQAFAPCPDILRWQLVDLHDTVALELHRSWILSY